MNASPPFVLAIDTATPACTVALTTGGRDQGQVLAHQALSSRVTHSRRLLGAIDRLLTESGVERESIGGYAIGLGPGSFTGLRIGMATVKGLAAAAGVPLYGVPSLDIVAAGCIGGSTPICAAIDARKNEVYAAWYEGDDHGRCRRITPIGAYSPSALARKINSPMVMVGDALRAYGDYWRSELGELACIAPAHLWSPSAATLGLLAGEQAIRGESLDLASTVPLYVRASDAELNLGRKIRG